MDTEIQRLNWTVCRCPRYPRCQLALRWSALPCPAPADWPSRRNPSLRYDNCCDTHYPAINNTNSYHSCRNEISIKFCRYCRLYCEAQARVRQGSARNGSQGKRPPSLNPCLELTLKLVATHPPTRSLFSLN